GSGRSCRIILSVFGEGSKRKAILRVPFGPLRNRRPFSLGTAGPRNFPRRQIHQTDPPHCRDPEPRQCPKLSRLASPETTTLIRRGDLFLRRHQLAPRHELT